MPPTVLQRLDDEQLVAFRCAGSAWPRALFAATLIPDKWHGLVMQSDGRRRYVPAGEDPQPERDDTLVLVRNHPIAVPLAVHNAPAADAHNVNAEVELLLRWTARDDDLAALARSLLSRDALTHTTLAEHVADQGGRDGLRSFVRTQPAAALCDAEPRTALQTVLAERLQATLFNAGAELAGLGTLTFESASYAAQRKLAQQTARTVAALEARGVVERAAHTVAQRRLAGLSELLDKLRQVSESDPHSTWRNLLPALTPGERGRLLENLWRLTPDRSVTRAIVVVAGRECVWLAPAEPTRIALRVTLPDDLGGLRCCIFDAVSGTLWLGAATGVWRIDAETGEIRRAYRAVVAEPPRTGFNAIAVADERVFATHSQLGVWSWNLADGTDAEPHFTPDSGRPRTTRAIVTDGAKRIFFATDERVRAWQTNGTPLWESPPADAVIHDLAWLDGELYAGTASGALQRLDAAGAGDWLTIHRGSAPIESIAARRWDDLIELVIPAGTAGISGIYAAEGFVSQLLRTPHAIRRAWASDDLLVGLADGRDRLAVLAANALDRDAADIPLARELGRSLQDVCLVVGPAATPESQKGASA